MNIYDVAVVASDNVSKKEKDYVDRFLLLNEDHFEYVEGLTALKMLLGKLREAQEKGVAIEIDTIWKRCPFLTYEDVTHRFIENGKVKESIHCEADGWVWKFEYPKKYEKEMEL